jgi:hypothetical protein
MVGGSYLATMSAILCTLDATFSGLMSHGPRPSPDWATAPRENMSFRDFPKDHRNATVTILQIELLESHGRAEDFIIGIQSRKKYQDK